MNISEKLCPLCNFKAATVSTILSHLRAFHYSDPRFLVSCGLSGCTTTLKSFSSLYSHIYRRHPSFIKKRAVVSEGASESSSEGVSDSIQYPEFGHSQDLDATGTLRYRSPQA